MHTQELDGKKNSYKKACTNLIKYQLEEFFFFFCIWEQDRIIFLNKIQIIGVFLKLYIGIKMVPLFNTQ